MTEREPDRLWSGIEIPKVMAGVLAAVTAAFLGSFLGVAGTLAGAALASVFGSVGTEIYHRSLRKGGEKLQSTFVTAPAAVGTPPVAAAADQLPSENPSAEPASAGLVPDDSPVGSSVGTTSAGVTSAAATSVELGGDDPAADATVVADRPGEAVSPHSPRKIRWARVLLVAGGFFIIAVGALTAFELISGNTVPGAVGAKADAKCTVCGIGDGKPKTSKTHSPAVSRTPSAAPSSPETSPSETAPSATPSVTASPTGTASEPATQAPSEPATTPSGGDASTGTTTPATPAPTQNQNQNPNQPAAPNADLRSPDEGNK